MVAAICSHRSSWTSLASSWQYCLRIAARRSLLRAPGDTVRPPDRSCAGSARSAAGQFRPVQPRLCQRTSRRATGGPVTTPASDRLAVHRWTIIRDRTASGHAFLSPGLRFPRPGRVTANRAHEREYPTTPMPQGSRAVELAVEGPGIIQEAMACHTRQLGSYNRRGLDCTLRATQSPAGVTPCTSLAPEASAHAFRPKVRRQLGRSSSLGLLRC